MKNIDMERLRKDAAALIAAINRGEFHLSASSLRNFADSPAHFIWNKCIRLQKDEDEVDTAAMIEGSLVHCLALEPHKVWDNFILNDLPKDAKPASANQSKFLDMVFVQDEILAKLSDEEKPVTLKDLNLPENWEPKPVGEMYAECYKVDKKDDPTALGEAMKAKFEKYLDFLKKAEGKKEITNDMLNSANMLYDALMNSRAGKYFDPLDPMGESEVGMKWEYAGINWRGYIDRRYNENTGVILDLKKTTDAHPKKFGWTVRDMHYDEQIELYRIASQMPDARGLLIALEPPFHISINEVHPSALRAARRKIDFYISEFKRCILEDAWWQSYGFYSTPAEDHDALLPTSFVFR
jgi:hypothetical protein